MRKMAPPPPEENEQLERTLAQIDELNSKDPNQVTMEGDNEIVARMVLDTRRRTKWVKTLEPQASDEMLILAKGRRIEEWELEKISRDAYAPNLPGMRQWEMDKKKWLADRLEGIMKENGYGENELRLVKEVMLNKDIPDPTQIRVFDVTGRMGAIDYSLLYEAYTIQVLKDAEILTYIEFEFPGLLKTRKVSELLQYTNILLRPASRRCLYYITKMKWTDIELAALKKCFPRDMRKSELLLNAGAKAAGSTHPGDWRYKDFQYE